MLIFSPSSLIGSRMLAMWRALSLMKSAVFGRVLGDDGPPMPENYGDECGENGEYPVPLAESARKL